MKTKERSSVGEGKTLEFILVASLHKFNNHEHLFIDKWYMNDNIECYYDHSRYGSMQ